MLKRGTVVLSLAGHDKGGYMVVLEASKKQASVCDGKNRKLEKPKMKNMIHVKRINKRLNEKCLESNKSIRVALSQLKRINND